MSPFRLIKNPFVIFPLAAGILFPCVVFLIMHFSRGTYEPQIMTADAASLAGQTLPATDLFEVDGSSAAPDLLRKGKVLLVFVTTECEACQKQLRLLSSVNADVSDKVRVYGVGIENRDKIKSFIKANAVDARILIDKDAKLMSLLRVRAFPAQFLLEDSRIVKTWVGNTPTRAELFTQLGL